MRMILSKIISYIPVIMSNVSKCKDKKPKKSSFFTKLVRDDSNFSAINFFLVAATIVGIALLIVPIYAMIVDTYYNHTLTLDLNGMAAYIVAVAGIFGAAGLTNAWTEYSYRKYDKNIFKDKDNENEEMM